MPETSGWSIGASVGGTASGRLQAVAPAAALSCARLQPAAVARQSVARSTIESQSESVGRLSPLSTVAASDGERAVLPASVVAGVVDLANTRAQADALGDQVLLFVYMARWMSTNRARRSPCPLK